MCTTQKSTLLFPFLKKLNKIPSIYTLEKSTQIDFKQKMNEVFDLDQSCQNCPKRREIDHDLRAFYRCSHKTQILKNLVFKAAASYTKST